MVLIYSHILRNRSKIDVNFFKREKADVDFSWKSMRDFPFSNNVEISTNYRFSPNFRSPPSCGLSVPPFRAC